MSSSFASCHSHPYQNVSQQSLLDLSKYLQSVLNLEIFMPKKRGRLLTFFVLWVRGQSGNKLRDSYMQENYWATYNPAPRLLTFVSKIFMKIVALSVKCKYWASFQNIRAGSVRLLWRKGRFLDQSSLQKIQEGREEEQVVRWHHTEFEVCSSVAPWQKRIKGNLRYPTPSISTFQNSSL